MVNENKMPKDNQKKPKLMKRIKRTTRHINKKCMEAATLRLKLAIEVIFLRDNEL